MNPTYPHYNYHGRTPQPDKPKVPTAAQRRTVATWLTRNLALASRHELEGALRAISAHPDANSAGYSRARTTRERLETELTHRPA